MIFIDKLRNKIIKINFKSFLTNWDGNTDLQQYVH